MIASGYIGEGHSVTLVLYAVGLPRSVYYYRQQPGAQGKKPSVTTRKRSGEVVDNCVVVEDIRRELQKEFVDYGYIKMAYCLRDNYGYSINNKKVYRLMKEHHLLYKPLPRDRSGKAWVKDLKPATGQAFSFWEFDIKYMYVAGKRKNALMLTVIDVKTRYTMGQKIEWSLKKNDVVSLFADIFKTYALPQAITVRNDNGSQFEAKLVREYLRQMHVTQEFCQPATPQQNGHIESYHSIIQRSICRRYEFESLEHLQETMRRFDAFYCNDRIHSGIDYMSPRRYALSLGVDSRYLCKTSETKVRSSSETVASTTLHENVSTIAAKDTSLKAEEINRPVVLTDNLRQSKVEYQSSF